MVPKTIEFPPDNDARDKVRHIENKIPFLRKCLKKRKKSDGKAQVWERDASDFSVSRPPPPPHPPLATSVFITTEPALSLTGVPSGSDRHFDPFGSTCLKNQDVLIKIFLPLD